MPQTNQQTYQYKRHEPEKTTLYKLIQGNWLNFQEQVQYDMGFPLPDFVIKEFDEYLRCGFSAPVAITRCWLRSVAKNADSVPAAAPGVCQRPQLT